MEKILKKRAKQKRKEKVFKMKKRKNQNRKPERVKRRKNDESPMDNPVVRKSARRTMTRHRRKQHGMEGVIYFADEHRDEHSTEEDVALLPWEPTASLEEIDAIRAEKEKDILKSRCILGKSKRIVLGARRANLVLDFLVRRGGLIFLPSDVGQIILNFLLVPNIEYFFYGMRDVGRYEVLQFHDDNHKSGVCDAYDTKNKRRVVLKKFSFDASSKRSKNLRKFLKCLVAWNHDNIVDVVDIIVPHDTMEMRNVIVVFPMRSSQTLDQVDCFWHLNDQIVKNIAFQILLALKTIELASQNRDFDETCDDDESCGFGELRLTNVFISRAGLVKVGYTGSCGISSVERDVDLIRMESQPSGLPPKKSLKDVPRPRSRPRLVRSGRMQPKQVDVPFAPEVIIASRDPSIRITHKMTKQIDLWSVGHILTYLSQLTILTASIPMWANPRDLPHHLLQGIIKGIGCPSSEYVSKLSSLGQLMFDQASNTSDIPGRLARRRSFPSSEYSLLDTLLEYDPTQRGKIDDALNHPYFRDFLESSPETTPQTDFSLMKKKMEEIDSMSLGELVEEVRYKITHFHPKYRFHFEPIRDNRIANRTPKVEISKPIVLEEKETTEMRVLAYTPYPAFVGHRGSQTLEIELSEVEPSEDEEEDDKSARQNQAESIAKIDESTFSSKNKIIVGVACVAFVCGFSWFWFKKSKNQPKNA